MDTRSDVYALGVLLYELVAGVRPLRRENANPVRFMQRLMTENPRTLAESWQELSPDDQQTIANSVRSFALLYHYPYMSGQAGQSIEPVARRRTSMTTVVATVVSAPTPIDGQDHNSSADFQFINLPTGGDIAVQISDNANSNNITFTLWEDVPNRRDDEIEEQLSNGSTFSVDKVEEGTNYYIGDPDNADNASFVVTFVV